MEKGYVVYEGKSLLNGDDIVVIATMKTNNRKTGDMVQTWILLRDIDPVSAMKKKMDDSICGACPHRWALGGDCYVNIGQAPLAVWRAYKKGSYKNISGEVDKAKYFLNRELRFGSYGDPSAVPANVWESMRNTNKQTGYTHQWKEHDHAKSFAMASVDSIEEKLQAIANGWRTFRVAYNDEVMADEIICPSVTRGVSCQDCGLCGGADVKAKNIVIVAHGARSKKLMAV